MQQLLTIWQRGNCSLAKDLPLILDIRPIGKLLGTSSSIMSRLSQIAITILAVATVTVIAPAAWSQTSEFSGYSARITGSKPAANAAVAQVSTN